MVRSDLVPALGLAAWAALCVAFTACTPGGEVALRARVSVAGGGALADCVTAAGGQAAVNGSDLAPDPIADPTLAAVEHQYFKITVLDAADDTPIAGATLTTVNDVVYTTDQNGVIAYYEPGLMGKKVWFFPQRDGYDVPVDFFGYHGKALQVDEGGSAQIAMNRVKGSNLAPSTDAGDLATRLLQSKVPKPGDCFGIRIVDQLTKRGVPLVMLSTEGESFVSDSQGYVADCNPDDWGMKRTFAVTSHGYRFDAGSLELQVSQGKTSVLEVTRQNVAERLYRSTGQGIYRDSVLLGLTTPLAKPLLNAAIMSQDSALSVLFKGQIFWVWGTNTGPAYPLSDFEASGARSSLPAQGGLDPRLGVNATYYTNSDGGWTGLSPNIAPAGQPTWVSSLVVVPDAGGEQEMFVAFAKSNSDLSLSRRGLLRFDPTSKLFVDSGIVYPLSNFVAPSGQAMIVRHAEQSYVYYGSPLRVPASAESMLDPKTYEVFSALPANGGQVPEQAADGSLIYGFKQGALATTASLAHAAGAGDDQVLDGHLTDITTGTTFQSTGGPAQYFNEYRARFVRLVEQVSGTTSFLGELWYLEGDTPMGPWVYARKVVSHDAYSFSGPSLQPFFEQDGGRFVFFEGNYTSTLAGNNVVNTPRYNHNQLTYRLDLDNPDLALPVAVYDTSTDIGPDFATKERLSANTQPAAATFFAPARAGRGTLPISWDGPACAPRRLHLGGAPSTPPLFYAVSPDDTSRAGNLVALYDFENAVGQHAYDTNPVATYAGFTRADAPLGYVWPSPIAVKLPVADYLGDTLANAGADQCLTERSAGSGADIELDASGSSNIDNASLSFSWRQFGQDCVIGTAATLHTHLAAGVYAFQVQVTASEGHAVADDVIVKISSFVP